LFGRPSQPTKVASFFSTVVQNSSGTLVLQQQQQQTVIRNQQRLARVALAAGSTSLLFGAKHVVASHNMTGDDDDDDDGVVSSAAAGFALATLYTPLSNVKTHMAATYRVLNVTEAALSLVRTQSLFSNAPRVYSREIAGAVVYFGTYERLKQALGGAQDNNASSTLFGVLVSGATAGVLYRSITFSWEQQGMRGFAPAMVRAIPAHAILFLGYESILSLATSKP
jgi:hypothetical protein